MVHVFVPARAGVASSPLDDGYTPIERALLARLDAIERRAGGSDFATAPGLEIPHRRGDEGVVDRRATPDVVDEVVARIEAGLAATVRAAIAETRATEEAAAEAERPKRLPLAEVAQQLELSRSEEAALRELYEDLSRRGLALLAGEDGNVQEVIDDAAAARAEPAKGIALMGKYLGRVLPKMGEFAALESERQQRTKEIVGPEKSERLEREFIPEERDPLGFADGFRIGVSARN